jgi:hypothetical protein
MIDQMISTSSKMFELWTTHIQNCDNDNCCVKELADKLFDDNKDSYGPSGPARMAKTSQEPNQEIEVYD